MGYQSTATTATLIAKLTPLGRELLVRNTNNLITKFALGDSDANYNVSESLTTGEVPSLGGGIGPNGGSSNSVSRDTTIRYPLFINSLGSNLKGVEAVSSTISDSLENNGQISNISGDSISQEIIDINDWATDSKVNLFTSFGLPLTDDDKDVYTATTYSNGGWADTALSGLSNDKIVVIGIDNNLYGENLDGKEIMLDLVTSAGTYTMYGTFQDKNGKLTVEDANYKDTTTTIPNLGTSVSFLVSDDIQQPNGGDVSLSWSTGFGKIKPFSVGKKELYNLQTNTNISKTADTVVGVAYLEKGLLVITEPTIVNNFTTSFSGSSATTVTINSVSSEIVQNITCIANRGEFGTSANPTWANTDTVRITEVGLYDKYDRLIAYGKFDRMILKPVNGFASFGVKIVV